METVKHLPLFLEQLRDKDIPVGIQEMGRLRRIFALHPDLNRQGLRDVLLCTLIKTPQQRQNFEDLFEVWCPPELPEPSPEEKAEKGEVPGEQVNVPAAEAAPLQPVHPESSAPKKSQPDLEPSPPRSQDNTPRRRLLLWIFAVLVLGLGAQFLIPFVSTTILLTFHLADSLFILFGTASWGMTYQIWNTYYRRKHVPPAPKTRELVDGPAWQPLPPLPENGTQLLTPANVRKMVWNVGRFVSEEFTRQLDARRTVEATARAGGRAVLHYQHVILPREVWLWVDQATHDLAMHRLIWEMHYTLERAGLPCRQASFREAPEPLTWKEGESFTPLSMEGHRQGAIVLVFSDGAGLKRKHGLITEGPILTVLLQALAEWPYLAFVDVSRGKHGLKEVLQLYGICCLAPEEIPAFLGADPDETGQHERSPEPFTGDLKAWAAGIALCPEAVDVKQALALHRAMGLRVEPWALMDLLEQSDTMADRLEWSPPQRAVWLNWLVRAEGIEGEISARSKLGRALQFWLQHYEQQEKKMLESPAAYRLTIERALLELWCHPRQAARDLYAVYASTRRTADSPFKEEIEQRLGYYVARWEDDPEPSLHTAEMRLPWRWEDLAPETRALLYRMGFASRWLSAAPLHVPGTLALTLGVFWGVAATLLLQGGVIGGVFLVGLSLMTGIKARQIKGQRLREEIAEPLDMVKISGGTFAMGSAQNDEQAYENEHPQHQVMVSDFLMARYPVTRKQYQEVIEESPAEWEENLETVGRLQMLWQVVSRRRSLQWLWGELQSSLPANYISWFKAVQFCNALSERQGLQPCYHIDGEHVSWDEGADGYRLPTEAEWEYAARAGTTTRWFCGDEATELERYAWFDEGITVRPHPVAQKEPNPWGLYDMAGNVLEWCWDWYGAYRAEAAVDPVGPATGESRVLRGGSAWNEASYLRSALRFWDAPALRFDVVGFRVVRRPGRQP